MKRKLTRLYATGLIALSLTGCAKPFAGVPDGLLEVCLAQPVPSDPETNRDLVEGFLAHREGHLVCRGIIEVIGDLYGND